ncbi:MAG: alpha/beta hydrolase [Acidobacteriota bacterium]
MFSKLGHYMLKATLIVFAALVILLIGMKLLVLFMEPRLTFRPTKGLTANPQDLGIPFLDLRLKPQASGLRPQALKLNAWYLTHPSPRAEIVFFHGNGGSLSHYLGLLAEMYERRFSVLAFDYRGYGESGGEPSEEGIYEDSRTTVDHFWNELYSSGKPVIYWGRSLGGITAACAARHRQPDALVLEATFPDKQSLMRYHALYSILAPFSSYSLSCKLFLQSVSCPVLVIHGDRDQVVPYALGKELFECLKGEKHFLTVPGAGHNNLAEIDPERYWEKMIRFVENR